MTCFICMVTRHGNGADMYVATTQYEGTVLCDTHAAEVIKLIENSKGEMLIKNSKGEIDPVLTIIVSNRIGI